MSVKAISPVFYIILGLACLLAIVMFTFYLMRGNVDCGPLTCFLTSLVKLTTATALPTP